MNERAFRLDFFIALAALVVSFLTTATLIYQTRVIEEQYSATIWPYLSLDTTTNPDGIKIALTNDGLGPALVRSAQLTIDGKAVSGWPDFLNVLKPEIGRITHGKASFGSTSGDTDESTILRPGTSSALLVIKGLRTQAEVDAIKRHAIGLNVCYCSLNGRCWLLHAFAGVSSSAGPHPVSGCPVGPHINA
jgi:hypothetical protein